MVINRARIITTWNPGIKAAMAGGSRVINAWDDISAQNLAHDILIQFRLLGAVCETGEGKWELSGEFDPYKRYVILDGRGKQLTHIRLAEREIRENRAKLAEARFTLLASQRAAREAGADSREITAFYDGLLRMLTQENLAAAARKKDGNQPRVITPDQPPDLPNLEIVCVKCGQPKPQTREFYEVWLNTQENGVKRWYWRHDCKECRMLLKNRNKSVAIREQVQDYVLEFTRLRNYPPTIRQVAAHTGAHGISVRYAWKHLAGTVEGFPPVPRPSRE